MQQDMNESTRVMDSGGAPIDRTMVAGSPAGVAPSDRTMVSPSPPYQGGAGGGAGATQMGQTVVCAVCRTSNSSLETYCGECGFLLASAPGQAVEPSPEETSDFELTETGSGRRFKLKSGPNTVGRENCDILLMDSTVSRRHAQVTLENGSVSVTDLGSTNGTSVDGVRLGPNAPTPLAPGASVVFGSASLTVSSASAGAAEATTVVSAASITVQVDEAPPAISDQTLVGTPGGFGGTETAAEAAEETPAETPAPDASAPAASPTPAAPADTSVVARMRPTSPAAEEILLREGTITLGRRTGNDVVISGDPYVSGKHAEISIDTTGCYLTDLGSTNGTTVNGQRMEAGVRTLLLDGDEVSLGQSAYVFETLNTESGSDAEETAPDPSDAPTALLAHEEPMTGSDEEAPPEGAATETEDVR